MEFLKYTFLGCVTATFLLSGLVGCRMPASSINLATRHRTGVKVYPRTVEAQPEHAVPAAAPAGGLRSSGTVQLASRSDEEQGDEVRQAGLVSEVEGVIRPATAPTLETPFGLDDAIQLALEASPDLVAAGEQVTAADAALSRARAEFFPKLGISEQYGVTNNPVTAFMFQLNQRQLNPLLNFNSPPTTDNFHTQLRLEQNLYSGERRLNEVDAARAQSDAATLDLVALHNQLVFRVAEAYYRVLQARELVEVRREAIDQVEQHLKIVQSRFRADTAVKSDVLTVEVRLAEVREGFISAQNQLELAWSVLENVIGAPIGTRKLPEAIPSAPWSDQLEKLDAAIRAAMQERAEVGAMANRYQAAKANVRIAESGKRVGVDLVGDYDVFTGGFEHFADSFFVGLVLRYNLFDGGRTCSEVARAAARVRELEARQRRLMLDIELDVRRSFLQLESAEARLEVATQAIDQAAESLREIEVRYRGQTASITQLVDAQVALSNARVRRISAQADVEVARVALQRAVGRLESLLEAPASAGLDATSGPVLERGRSNRSGQ